MARRSPRPAVWTKALLSGALTMLALVLPAHAQADYITGVDDTNVLLSPDAGIRDQWFDEAVDLRVGIARFDVVWAKVVGIQPPADPTNPLDPAYDFSSLDAAIQDAAERGLDVELTFLTAPAFAERGNEPGAESSGSWKPDPDALGDFAQAVATRYSGAFKGLPRVRYYEAWNEANLSVYLDPQYKQGENVAVDRYRRMLNAVDKAINAVHPDNLTIAGGLAPYGDDPGGIRTRPLEFLRKLMCLKANLEKTSCKTKPRFDILSHHPINLSGPPRQSAVNPDDASSADMKNVDEVLRAAERAGTIAGGSKHHPLWVTEFWWESYPDGPHAAIPGLKEHGRWIEEALYLFWKAGAKAAIHFTLEDEVLDKQHPDDTLQTGLFLHDGDPKPAARAFRFPFVTERTSKRQLTAWAIAPVAGKLRIQRKSGSGWRTLETENVKAGKVVTAKLSLKGTATLRARVSGETSLSWPQGAAVDEIIEAGKAKIRQATGPPALRESVSAP